jgi:rhodanese-related sulfurtransferase
MLDIRLKGVAEVGRAEESIDGDEQGSDLGSIGSSCGRRATSSSTTLCLLKSFRVAWECIPSQPSEPNAGATVIQGGTNLRCRVYRWSRRSCPEIGVGHELRRAPPASLGNGKDRPALPNKADQVTALAVSRALVGLSFGFRMIEDTEYPQKADTIMDHAISAVLEYGAPDPGETATLMEAKLRFHTDSWDLSVDLKAGVSEIVVIDARSRDAYAAGHIPGAISFPRMSAETTVGLDRSKVYVVYCDGIGCNGSTKGSYKLARLGFRTKELLGGLDWWSRDGHPVMTSLNPGSLQAAAE